MSLDLTLIAALWVDQTLEPSVMSKLRTFKGGDFPYRMRNFAKTHARPLPLPLVFSCPGRRESYIKTDPYGDPLTYLTPDQIADLHDDNPTNEAALEFLRHHDFQERLIIVLYWE